MTALLTGAGLDLTLISRTTLNKDEDGTHSRILLQDGRSYLAREYATTTKRADVFRLKEMAFYASLADGGIPVPRVLSSIAGSGVAGGDAPALLLTDPGGTLLEELFRTVTGSDQTALWRAVGTEMRRLHDVEIEVAGPLARPERHLSAAWFISDLTKVLLRLQKAQPQTSGAVRALLDLRRRLRDYLDARPLAVRHGEGWYLPEMLMRPVGRAWKCASWLGWGYYASVGDPMLDIVGIDLIHREWTGALIPRSFYQAYGAHPDPVCRLAYEAYLQLWRAPAFARPQKQSMTGMNKRGPQALATLRPPHPTSLTAMDALPQTVEQLAALLT